MRDATPLATCACGFACALDPRTAAYHAAHEVHHAQAFPQSTPETLASLRLITKMFERREARAQEQLS